MKSINNHQWTHGTHCCCNEVTDTASPDASLLIHRGHKRLFGHSPLHESLNHAKDAIIVIDDEECCVDVNWAACKLFDVEKHSLIGTYIITDLVGLDFDAVWQTLSRDTPTCGELQLTRPDGLIRHVEFSAIANVSSYLHVLVLRDITAQKSAEHQHQMLQDHHQMLQDQVETFFELSLDLLAIANMDGFFVHLNPAWEQTLGFTIDELKSVDYLEFVHPDDRERTSQAMKQLMGGKSVTSFENRYRTKDGGYRWLSWRSKPDSSKQLIYATVRDVTAQKEAEHRLRQRARQEQALNRVIQVIHQSLDLNQIFSTSAAEIATFLDGEVAIVQYVPDRACWVYRIVYNRGEQSFAKVDFEIPDKDNPFADLLKNLQTVQVDDTDTIDDPINRDLAQASPGSWLLTPISIDGEVWGSLFLGRSRQNQQPWQDDEINLAQGVANQLAIAIHQSQLYRQVQTLNTNLEAQVADRTAKFQTALSFESALKRITDKVRDSLDENQILRTAVEELAHILEIDCCDTALYNDAQTLSTIVFEISKGWPSFQGQSFLIQDSPNAHMYESLRMGQECQACDLNHSYMRETSYPTVALAVPIFDDQHVLGDLWLFKPAHQVFNTQEIRLVRQVANQCAIALRQARLYQTAQRQVAELEQLNHMKDEILSMVSHDLRSPMANIKMAAEMLQVSLKRLCVADTENNTNIVINMERYIQILSRECHRETELLNDLLDLARVESGNVSLDSVLVQLEKWLHALLDAFDDGLKSRRQHLHVLVPSDLSIYTDLFCLERVVTELLHNACKYTPADGRIWVMACSTGSNIELSVCNSGVEISPEECDRIFDKFYRIPHNDPWKQGGTGLGLALSKELVHKLRGDITVESSHNQTCFTVTLPIHPLPIHPLPPQENSANSLEDASLPTSKGHDPTKRQNQWPNPCMPMSRYADV